MSQSRIKNILPIGNWNEFFYLQRSSPSAAGRYSIIPHKFPTDMTKVINPKTSRPFATGNEKRNLLSELEEEDSTPKIIRTHLDFFVDPFFKFFAQFFPEHIPESLVAGASILVGFQHSDLSASYFSARAQHFHVSLLMICTPVFVF